MKFKELKKQNKELVDLVNNQKLAFDKMCKHYEIMVLLISQHLRNEQE